jgi:hypothetical protein
MDLKKAKAQFDMLQKTHGLKIIGKKRKLKMKKSNENWARNRPWPNKGKNATLLGLVHTTD